MSGKGNTSHHYYHEMFIEDSKTDEEHGKQLNRTCNE